MCSRTALIETKENSWRVYACVSVFPFALLSLRKRNRSTIPSSSEHEGIQVALVQSRICHVSERIGWCLALLSRCGSDIYCLEIATRTNISALPSAVETFTRRAKNGHPEGASLHTAFVVT